jgi:hypothetical protein
MARVPGLVARLAAATDTAVGAVDAPLHAATALANLAAFWSELPASSQAELTQQQPDPFDGLAPALWVAQTNNPRLAEPLRFVIAATAKPLLSAPSASAEPGADAILPTAQTAQVPASSVSVQTQGQEPTPVSRKRAR